MTTFDEIIKLHYKHDKYKKFTYPELYYHILPSINHNQYKIFKDDAGIFGFVNWAFLNEDAERRFKKQAQIYKNEWNNGSNLWLYDIIISRKTKEVMSWVYNYFKKKLSFIALAYYKQNWKSSSFDKKTLAGQAT